MSDQAEGQSKSEPEKEEFGLLLVHGIGTQRRAGTLVDWAEPMVRWLERWLAHPAFGEKKIEVEVLGANLDGTEGPAHAWLGFRSGIRLSHRRWLMAESWWAESFEPPRLRELLRWMLVALPHTVAVHFVPPMRVALHQGERASSETDPRVQRMLNEKFVASVLTSLFLLPVLGILGFVGFVVSLCVAVLWLLGLIPVNVLRDKILAVQVKLASVIGDSFIYLYSPIRRSATISRVHADLQWLAARCKKVVIVAHSQGAAVSHEALRQLRWMNATPSELKGFVTVGSGLRKLYDLKKAGEHPGFWSLLGLTAILTPVLMVVSIGLALSEVSGAWLPWVVCPIGLVILLVDTFLPALAIDRGPTSSPPHLSSPWVDFFATHDPVPNGPLLAPGEAPTEWVSPFDGESKTDDHLPAAMRGIFDFSARYFRASSHKVTNFRSYLADHNTYIEATDGFLTSLMLALGRLSEMDFALTLDSAWRWLGALRREWRVRLLSAFRLAIVAAFVALMIRHFSVSGELGAAVNEAMGSWLPKVSIPDELLKSLEWFGPFFDSLVGIAAVAMILYVIYRIGLALWRGFEAREFKWFFTRTPYQLGGFAFPSFLVAWLLSVLGNGWLWLTKEGEWASLDLSWPGLSAFAFVAVWSIWRAVDAARNLPGTSEQFGLLALAEADRHKTGADKKKEPELARYCYTIARELLGTEQEMVDWLEAEGGEESSLDRLGDPERRTVLERSLAIGDRIFGVLARCEIVNHPFGESYRRMLEELSRLGGTHKTRLVLFRL